MPLRPKSALDKEQNLSIDLLYENTSALALLPVGAGKTVIGWTAAVELMDAGIVKRPVVFAPRMVAINEWPGQRFEWEHLQDREIVEWGGEPSSWPDSLWKRSRLFWGQRTNAERRLPNVAKNHTAKNDALKAERKALAERAWAERHILKGSALTRLRHEIIRQQNKGLPLSAKTLRSNIRDEEELLTQLIAGVKWQETQVNKVIRKTDHPEVLHVTSYENIEWFCELYPVGDTTFDLWIFDEIGKLKNPKSPRYKMISKRTKAVLASGGSVWGLNATPAPEGFEDLFTQVQIVDGGKLWGKSFYQWRQKYFTPADYLGYDWRPQLGAREILLRELDTIAFRVDEEDLRYKKNMRHNQIKVDMPAGARAHYETMRKELAVELAQLKADSPSEAIVALSAAAASMKLRQITQGFIYDGDGKAHVLHTEKADALSDLIDAMNGEPLLVAYEFKEDLEAIRRVYGNKLPYIGSGVNATKVKQNIEDWNSRKLKVLAIHPLSAGHGLNLQHGGSHIAWYALPWPLESFLQANGRLDRQGQTRACFGHHIIVRNTIDQRVSDVLMNKDIAQREIIDAIRRA